MLGKHSGRRAVAHCAANAGVTLDDQQTSLVLDHLKHTPLRRSYESKSEVLGLLDEVFPDNNFDRSDSTDASEDLAEPTIDGPKPR